MKKFLVIIMTVLSTSLSAQISFESGYFISEAGERTECLIKNLDWNKNPSEFEFRMSETGDTQIMNVSKISEFGVSDKLKFIKRTVNIDRSSDLVSRFNTNRNAEYNEETILLKVLVDGKASLYSYADATLKKYFYQLNTGDIEQLFFKSYYTNEDRNTVSKNFQYKQQILNKLKCQSISLKEIEKLQYKQKNLTDVFVRYNECEGESFSNFEKKDSRKQFYFSLRPGVTSSELFLFRGSDATPDIKPDKNISFRLGLEVEFIMPIRKSKWGIIFEPVFHSFSGETSFNDIPVEIDYRSIDLPFGIRHHFYLDEKSNIFINASFGYRVDLNSKVKFKEGSRVDLEARRSAYFPFGIGYNYNRKYSIEFRYSTDKHGMVGDDIWIANSKRLSLILGVTL